MPVVALALFAVFVCSDSVGAVGCSGAAPGRRVFGASADAVSLSGSPGGLPGRETTTLVRKGVFGFVRNPIFTAMLIFGLGIALVTPNAVAIVGFVLLVLTIEVQVRVVEEPYLATKHGAGYEEYTASVGRFVPGVGLIRR